MIRVVTSGESADGDQRAIAAGIPSRALMQRAGSAAAGEIARRFRGQLSSGVLVLAGPGNNGGDAWVVARALHATGVCVRVIEPIDAKTPDAIFEKSLAVRALGAAHVISGAISPSFDTGESLVVDGLLGTGGRGVSTGAIADAIRGANRMRDRGALIVSLDVPSGVDATSGQSGDVAIIADLTLTFGSVKRGQLINRDACGAIVALDIGLLEGVESVPVSPKNSVIRLIDDAWVARTLPPIAADSHKGTRKKLAIVGGGDGMAGAAVLAARAALRSGIGMVKLIVAPESVRVVQEAEPYALAAPWPVDDESADSSILKWADAVIIGPGLGRADTSRALLERVLRLWRGPTLLDADAITLFEKRADDLATLLDGRVALLTPHPLEYSRLAGVDGAKVSAERFEIANDLAARLKATILLKGVPTVITSPTGERLVSATGTPVLATGGSGDVLTGIAGTMLAQMNDSFTAGAVAAHVHGRAAEHASASVPGSARGVTLEEIVAELRNVWAFGGEPTRYPVLAELPAIGR